MNTVNESAGNMPLHVAGCFIEIRETAAVKPERIAYVISTAMEGGINYWADTIDVSGVVIPDDLPAYLEDWPSNTKCPLIGECKLYDGEEDAWHQFGPKEIIAGLQLMASTEPAQFRRMFVDEDGNYDADDADQFIQLCVFGEVIYG